METKEYVYVVFRMYQCDCCTNIFKGVYTSKEEMYKDYPCLIKSCSDYFYEEVPVNEVFEV